MRKRQKKIIKLFDSAVEAENIYEFFRAKKSYSKVTELWPKSPEADIARDRINDMDALIREKQTYK